MIGLQELMIKQNIKVKDLAKELGIDRSNIWYWFNENRIPEKRLEALSKILDVDMEYLNKKVNDISTYKPKEVKKFNDYKICGDYTIIYLEKKDGRIFETLIDTEDLERIIKLGVRWNAAWGNKTKAFYAKSSEYLGIVNGKRKAITRYLHKEILNSYPDMQVDHIGHYANSTLDNRKQNLRYVDRSQNNQNRNGGHSNSKTGVRNVNWIEKEHCYYVQIMKNGEKYKWKFPINQFEEACEFAEQKRIELFGEYAGLSYKQIRYQ